MFQKDTVSESTVVAMPREMMQPKNNELVMRVCEQLKTYIKNMKILAEECPGSYVGYEHPTGRSAEERVYLLDPVSGLRWSVARAFIIADPGTAEQRDLESFTITVREEISKTPLRLFTRKLWITPFLTNLDGERGCIISNEQVEQLEDDSSKSLVAFDTITRTAMAFKRVGKRFANGEYRKELALKRIETICSRGQEHSPAHTAVVGAVVESLFKNGLTLHLPSISYQEAAKMRSKEKVISLRPSSGSVILQGIREVLAELIQDKMGKDTSKFTDDTLIELSEIVFDTLIGTWSAYLEEEHGTFILTKEGDFEIPPLLANGLDNITANMSARWADIARCFKEKKVTDQDINEILSKLSGLRLVPVDVKDLEVTEGDKLLVEIQKHITVVRKSGPLRIV